MLGHVIIIGGSMSGLLTARVLAELAERVTVIERDEYPEAPGPRKGLPQARHLHILLTRGRMSFDELFPGWHTELLAAGSQALDLLQDVHWLSPIGWSQPFPSDMAAYPCSRDLLDWVVRRRVEALRSVSFRTHETVLDLVTDAAQTRVTGVRVQRRIGGEETLTADLVVDATGRHSHVPRWLEARGYPVPEETVVNSFVGYATRAFRLDPAYQHAWGALMVQAAPPTHPRGAAIFRMEDDTWLVTLAGAGRDYPPTDEAGFMAFVQSLRTPLLYEALQNAQPASTIHGYRDMTNRWRHYERLPRYLDGLVVLGDAACAFNPIYGQGITVATLGAQTLAHLVRTRAARGLGVLGLTQVFQQDLARTNEVAWLMATSEDYRYPTTEGGERTPAMRLMHGYTNQMLQYATRDPLLARTVMRAIHMVDPPQAMFSPQALWAMGRTAWRMRA